MKSGLNRRSFLRTTALAAGAITGSRFLSAPRVLAAASPDEQLNCVLIGLGSRGNNHLEFLVTRSKENILALVDPDDNKLADAKRYLQRHNYDPDKVQTFNDYRKMYDKIGKTLDAVIIAAPNHHHACASILGMQRDKPVFCEKPLTHDIAEARKLRAMAAKSKAATQMGNQGHCEEGYRRLCEFVEAGVIGNITETHSWTDRANGGVGPRPPALPVPKGLHWDSWIGPAPYRNYHADLHPHEWHGWYDFGNGSLGNMGCHVLDGVFWALKVGHPASMELEEVRGGSDERYPTGCRLRWDIPARGTLPALKAYWYEGLKIDAKGEPTGASHAARGADQNLPPILAELKKKYPDEEFDASGTIYVGDKGIISSRTYGGRMHVLPLEGDQHAGIPKTLPRPENVLKDFLAAVRADSRDTAVGFDYGAQLTEFCLLGNLAQHAGLHNKVEWDGPNMKVTNLKDLNAWVNRPYRKGWPS
jgi:predicted dehydrogenase